MQHKSITRRGAIKTLGGISLIPMLGIFNSCGLTQNPNKSVQQVVCGKYTISVTKRIDVSVNPDRNFHSVSACRAPNGDFLVSHQDALGHLGGDCFVHQWRSKDEGLTWQDEGAAIDLRQEGLDARAGEYGVTSDGRMVMVVQRVNLKMGDLNNDEIVNNTWYASSNSGKTWKYKGVVDPSHEKAVLAPRSVLSFEGTMYFGAYSRKDWMAPYVGEGYLYVSEDNGESWQRRSVIFPHDYPDIASNDNSGPYYPHVMFLENEDLLAMCFVLLDHLTPQRTCQCFTRLSKDQGRTWGNIRKHSDLPVWAPRMNKIGDNLLVVTGRSLDDNAVIALFSTDNGKNWGSKLILERPKDVGNCAYTQAIPVGNDKLWVYTSTSANVIDMPDVAGILVEINY